MDNIGEIIILIIFIVISMIGGLSKDKKKKRQQESQYPPQREPVRKKSETIFDEILIEKKDEDRSDYYGEEYEEHSPTTWNPEDSYTEKAKYSTSSIKSNIPTKATSEHEFYIRKMKELELDPKKTKSLYSIPSASEKSSQNGKNIHIKQLLKSPTNLKDYVLISDILGKPKALRR